MSLIVSLQIIVIFCSEVLKMWYYNNNWFWSLLVFHLTVNLTHELCRNPLILSAQSLVWPSVFSLFTQVVIMSIFWWKSEGRIVTWVSSSWTGPRLSTLCVTGWWRRWDKPWMPSRLTATSELSSSPAVTEPLLVSEPSVFSVLVFVLFGFFLAEHVQ